MSRFDHESRMYRFPSFHETTTCDQAKTAQESLKDILAKFPSASRSSSAASSPPSSSSSSTSSTVPPPPFELPPASQGKRPSNASDYKWISTGSRASATSSRKRQSSLGSTKTSSNRSSVDGQSLVSAWSSTRRTNFRSALETSVEMGSSKGEPDNPKLREQCKEEVKNMEKGGGKGSWSAWKAGELARLYESRGGGYKDSGDNKNKPQKGYPERKDGKDNRGVAGEKKDEKKEKESGKSDEKKNSSSGSGGSKKGSKK